MIPKIFSRKIHWNKLYMYNLGQKFAIYEQKCIVSWIIRKFRIEAKSELTSNKPCPEVVLVPSSQLYVTLHKR